ncbi:MAG: winged helix-turn-helix domain-containing protein [Gemmiger sp.]|nr:winged helix-turn-helix domain-containing protein [Gemmiger sp.]
MNKKISFIPLDSTLAAWLLEKLEKDPPGGGSGEELRCGLCDLMAGSVTTLLLGAAGEVDAIANTAGERIQVGELEIQKKSRRVLRGGQEVNLTPKEFDILFFLVQNRGEVFTKEQIYRAVWEEDFLLADSNMMAFIRKLRKKIEPNPDAPEYILTIWGIGYKFNDAL